MPSKRFPEVWGAAEIARHLGVSRQRVQQLIMARNKDADDPANSHFPDPVVTLDMGKIWLADAVRAWAKNYSPKHRTGPRP